MKHAWPTLLTVAATFAGVILLCASDIPLGVPGEWTWPRIPITRETWFGWLIGLAGSGLYVAFIAFAAVRVQRRPWIWLGTLTAAGFVWLTAVQSTMPGLSGLAKSHFVLYYPRSSGYFWQARYDVSSTSEFLRDYEQLLAERDYLHIGTHPPGLTVCYRGLLSLCESSPSLTNILLQSQPPHAREAAESIQSAAAKSGMPYRDVDIACVWLSALITQLIAALAVVPIYGLLRQFLDRPQAWQWAAFWPLVPALAVFWPKSDLLYALPAALCAWLWMEGWRRRSTVLCASAGFIGAAGMLLSLALAPVALMLGVWSVLQVIRNRSTTGSIDARRPMISTTAGTIGFLIPIALLWLWCEINMFRVWAWNFSNHALFYDHNPRTYWAWLLVNPVETAFAAGWPLAIFALRGVWRQRRTPEVLAIALVWGLLWVSGKNMGEAARLWIVLLPWLVVCAGCSSKSVREEDGELRAGVDRNLLLLLLVQAIACVVTVTTVDGFHFAELAM